jgi:hypothetical protein
VPEDSVVRQYRYLLRTAPIDALEAAHAQALPLLSEPDRQTLLETIRNTLLVGDHLTPSHTSRLAHLITLGERRAPRALFSALPAHLLRDLATNVLDSEASFGLLSDYPDWDGADPETPDDSAWRDGGFIPGGVRGSPGAANVPGWALGGTPVPPANPNSQPKVH